MPTYTVSAVKQKKDGTFSCNLVEDECVIAKVTGDGVKPFYKFRYYTTKGEARFLAHCNTLFATDVVNLLVEQQKNGTQAKQRAERLWGANK